MRGERKYISVDSEKHGILINGMIYYRNSLLEQGKPVEDVNGVIDDLVHAHIKKEKRYVEREGR